MTNKKVKFKKLQKYVYAAYLYLLILGTISYALYYSFIGVNIISYSNVLDILLSPVIILTKNYQIPLILCVFLVFVFAFVRLGIYLSKQKLKKDITEKERLKIEKSIQSFKPILIFVLALGIFGFYIGFALGSGFKYKKRLKEANLEADHLIEFVNGTQEKVKLFGSNSQYIIYGKEKDSSVFVVPIQGNVMKIIKNVD